MHVIALGQRIKLPSFDLNAKLMDALDVNERPPPIVKLLNVQHHAQLLATFFMDNPVGVTPTYIMKL